MKRQLWPWSCAAAGFVFLHRLLGDLALSTQNQGQSLGTTVPFSSDLVTEHILWLTSEKAAFCYNFRNSGGKNLPKPQIFSYYRLEILPKDQ